MLKHVAIAVRFLRLCIILTCLCLGLSAVSLRTRLCISARCRITSVRLCICLLCICLRRGCRKKFRVEHKNSACTHSHKFKYSPDYAEKRHPVCTVPIIIVDCIADYKDNSCKQKDCCRYKPKVLKQVFLCGKRFQKAECQSKRKSCICKEFEEARQEAEEVKIFLIYIGIPYKIVSV